MSEPTTPGRVTITDHANPDIQLHVDGLVEGAHLTAAVTIQGGGTIHLDARGVMRLLMAMVARVCDPAEDAVLPLGGAANVATRTHREWPVLGAYLELGFDQPVTVPITTGTARQFAFQVLAQCSSADEPLHAAAAARGESQ